MNVLNANTLIWSQLNIITNVLIPRGGYTANILNINYIVYVGGLLIVNSVCGNVDMNE
ncbi:20588_t:CDS:1, partial [Gigaspora rosea]